MVGKITHIGTVAAQIITSKLAPIKAPALPVKHTAQSENLSNKFFFIKGYLNLKLYQQRPCRN